MMTIHKEGYRILTVAFIGLLSINLLFRYVMPVHEHAVLVITAVSLGLFLFVTYFFRKPRRKFVLDTQYIMAPADGRVVTVEETVETEYFNEKRLLVSIFMSPTNVHVNWNPMSGTVTYSKYHPGKYLVAYNPKSSTLNERNTMVIEEDGVEILVRQIAGLLARRIVSYVEEGQRVMQGSEFGFIKFGSRIDMYLPLDAVVEVDLKQRVKGGKTIIARIP